jgi:asparagine synthase (glutamine-hydrolysing)
MCGIAGILSHRGPIERIETRVEALVRDLHHRGPDDQGVWISPDNRAGVTATRLAILDLSPAGHQPMASADGRYIIVFNGEIYNFRELRAELVSRDAQFQSHSDTEVILKLYVDLGAGCVSKLRGMFAFAIWDAKERTCFLARDPLGIKPLYYFYDQQNGIFLFGSELKPLLRTGLVPKKLCSRGLFGFFRTGSVPEPYTLIEDVRCLEAGSTILWRDGEIIHNRYWRLDFAAAKQASWSESEAVAITREALLDSVAHHFVSDVPVGIFLSGGVDSTALVALARASRQEGELRTFSIGTDDESRNEANVARRTAEHFKTKHVELNLDAKTARPLFKQFLQSIDQPTVDGFNTFLVSKVAHEADMKVVLSGLGADEIFGGYASFARLPKLIRANRSLRLLRPIAPALVNLVASIFGDNRWRRFAEFLDGPCDVVSAYRSFRGIFTSIEARHLVKLYITDDGNPELLLESARGNEVEIHDAISKLEIELYMRNQLLRDSDVMSMAWELELRVPFVDRCLLETLTQIPPGIRLKSGKALLTGAIPELPEWIRQQPKRGFLLPFEKWRASEWFPNCPSTASNSINVPMNSWYQKWTMSVLEAWLQQIA